MFWNNKAKIDCKVDNREMLMLLLFPFIELSFSC